MICLSHMKGMLVNWGWHIQMIGEDADQRVSEIIC